VFTEGEYRRAGWSTAIRDSVDGLVPTEGSPIEGFLGQWQGPHAEAAYGAMRSGTVAGMVVAEKIRQVRRLTGVESAFLKAHAPGPWKITMPGAMSSTGQLFKPGVTDKVYPNRQALAWDIVPMMQAEIRALQDEGCPYIQIDSLHYVERVADKTIRARMIAAGEDPDKYLDDLIEIDNATLSAVQRDRDVTVGMHMCRGNNRSAWHAEGSYEPVAEKAFAQLNVDRFLLEFDTERAGGFEPLRFLAPGKMVMLGLISSKEPELESIDSLRRRIDEAAKYVPLENLAIGPQCGFASTQFGNLLTWDEQKRKLELVVETAQKVWG
jgi:5-methyltetrahydropteroyltriglutamate--homocysteine methyltransferase